MALDRSAARRIAELAQLDVDEEELDRLVDSMAGIVALVDELGQAESLGGPLTLSTLDTLSPPAVTEWDDTPEPGLDPEIVRANAPETASDGSVPVPPMMRQVSRRRRGGRS